MGTRTGEDQTSKMSEIRAGSRVYHFADLKIMLVCPLSLSALTTVSVRQTDHKFVRSWNTFLDYNIDLLGCVAGRCEIVIMMYLAIVCCCWSN